MNISGSDLVLEPSTALIGQTVTYAAQGFLPTKSHIVHGPHGIKTVIDQSETVIISFVGVPGTCGSQDRPVASATPDGTGTIRGSFVVTNIPCYTVTLNGTTGFENSGASPLVQAVGSQSKHAARHTLDVPATTISVAVQHDGRVSVEGAGYEPYEYVFLRYYYGARANVPTKEDAGVVHADQNGKFQFMVPAGYGLSGGYGIVGSGTISGFTAGAQVS